MNSKQRRKLFREIHSILIEASESDLQTELIQASKQIAQLEREVDRLRRLTANLECWNFRDLQDGTIEVTGPIDGCLVQEVADFARETPEEILWALAKDIMRSYHEY